MDKNLIIELIQDANCNLTIVDNSAYSDLGSQILNYVSLEFLVYNEETEPIKSSIKVTTYKTNRDYYLLDNTIYTLSKDGIYSYQKYLIPKLEFLSSVKNGVTYYKIKNEIFYYNGKIYLGPTTGEEEYLLADVEKNSTHSTYMDLLEYLNNNGGSQTFFAEQKLFSICKLQKCLISLQKSLLLTNAKFCSFEKCNMDQMLKARCDFLLCAVYTLNYLICNQNYIEAQRILDNLTACEDICVDRLDNTYNGCGCG